MAILLHEIPHEVSAQIPKVPMLNMGVRPVWGFGVGLAH